MMQAEIVLDDILIPLLAFFAFPIIQYTILKIGARKKGAAELWYMRRFKCFRLVIRNETQKRILTDIKVRVRTRKMFPEPDPLTTSFKEEILDDHEELFTFPGTDHVMVCFRVEKEGDLGQLVITDKFGIQTCKIPFDHFDVFLCDYIATVKNPFNFDFKLAKRITLTQGQMMKMFEIINASTKPEEELKLDSDVVDAGF